MAIVRKKNGEFYASTVNGGRQSEPRVEAFPGGGYIVVWETATQSDIRAQRFDSSGAMVGGEIAVTATANTDLDPEVVVLSSGEFVIVWSTYAQSQPFNAAQSLVGQRYAADGTPLGDRFTVAPPGPQSYSSVGQPSLFALPNGGFVASWAGEDTWAQVYDSTATPVGNPILIDTDSTNVQLAGISLGNDRFVLLWQDMVPFANGTDRATKSQIFDLAGNKIGAETNYGNILLPAVAALAGGGYVVSAETQHNGGARIITAQRYDSSGAAVGAQIIVSDAVSNSSVRGPDIVALPWGGFLIAWFDNTGGSARLRGQLFDGEGNRIGTDFQINTVAVTDDFEGVRRHDLTLLPSGEVVAVWKNDNDMSATQLGIKAQHLLMPIAGTAAADILEGTVGDDVIIGLGGNDIASGGSGADEINGGSGDDTLSGGAGADILDGSTGTDTADYSGEAAPVAVNLSSLFLFPAGHPFAARSLSPGEALDGSGNYDTLSGIENLILTSGNDRVVGSETANRIEAGSGADNVSAAGGDDVVLAGSGADTVFGGLGNDTIDGGDDSDTLIGEGGTDTIDGGGGNDLILGGTDNDVVGGGLGNDVLVGESGNDILSGGEGNDGLVGGSGADSYDGGSGGETVNGLTTYGDGISFADRTATQAVIADLRNGTVSNDGFGNVETMVNIESLGGGTAFGDIFFGNDSANSLDAAVDDQVYGFGGDDIFTLRAAPGWAEGGDGTDLIRLDVGNGWLRPDSNGDGLAEIAPPPTAGWDIDLASGGVTDGYGNVGMAQGFESISGSVLDDAFFGTDGVNDLRGADGDDLLFGRGGNDSLDGGSGDDTIQGNDGDDTIVGGAGNDLLRGGSGIDSFDGGADDGAFYDDSFGHGDRVSFFEQRATQGVVADLRSGTIANDGFGNVETMTGIESLGDGTAFADTFYGNDSINFLMGGIGDSLYGFGGDDILLLGSATAVVDGGSGADILELTSELTVLLPDSNGDGNAETAPAMTTGWTVSLAAGTLRDGYGNVGTVAGIETLIGSALRDELRGSSGNDGIEGGGGNDVLLLQDGGDDHVLADSGNDVIYFGSALSAGDIADGGEGRDAVVFQGNVTAVLTDLNLIDIESISIQSGANAFFGDTANNFYDYNVTTANGNVAAGQQLIVNAQSLRAGEDFTFDGSAESDGRFLIYGGHGVDVLTGGNGADVFFFEGQRWSPTDKVDGGAGRDSMVISAGDGLNRIEFVADSLANIESISLNNLYASDPSQRPSYELVLHNGNVAAGGTLIVNGNSIPLGQVVNVDGRGVHDGNLILFAGGGHDVLIGGDGADLLFGGGGQDSVSGGLGADTFRYDSVSDSPAGAWDLIGDFQTGLDKIDLGRIDANSTVEGNQAFSWIGSNAFSGSAGQLRAYFDNGYQRIEGDTDGDGAADFAILLQLGTAPIVSGDFLL